jgi:outer membrane scaffolding protein for murein synthesis (MipA/OmpV family)
MLRADRDTAGIRAFNTQNFEIDIGVAGSFGAGSESINARQGMPELGTLVELGPRLKWNLGAAPGNGRWRAEIPLRGVFDLSNRAEHKGLSFEPKLIYERQSTSGWSYNASVGAIFADTKLAQTFYEVNSTQATALRPAYAASSGLVAWRLGSSFSRSLSRDWRLFGLPAWKQLPAQPTSTAHWYVRPQGPPLAWVFLTIGCARNSVVGTNSSLLG